MVRALRSQRTENEMFIYSVSHDLRSPLVNLQGFSKELARATQSLRETLRDEDLPESVARTVRHVIDEEMPESLHYIDLAVQRQARIIDSLLSLSRAGRVEYQWTDVDIESVIRPLAAVTNSGPNGQHVVIEVDQLPAVRGDRDALERLFDNLISNAVKYLSPDRPGKIQIGCREQTANRVVLFVRDNGIGIDQANHERVFLPFSRFGGGSGEGIGLSLVRRVVERHHGRVWIESEIGAGTTVLIAMPPAQA